MQLYYFGSGRKPLFGVYHPAHEATRRSDCILLCPPIGTELLRSYRAFRQLATQLSKAGYHVLRFDYYGTGDSSGDCTEGDLEQWQEDIATAAEELCDMAGVKQVSVVGLRLGATLAAKYAKSNPLSRLVLWEPVTDGPAYLEDRIAADLWYETEIDHKATMERKLATGEPVGIMGFAWSDRFRKQVKSIDQQWFDDLQSDRTYLLVRASDEKTEQLKVRLQGNPGKFGYEQIDHPGEWGEFDEIGSLLLPQATIKAIVACLQ